MTSANSTAVESGESSADEGSVVLATDPTDSPEYFNMEVRSMAFWDLEDWLLAGGAPSPNQFQTSLELCCTDIQASRCYSAPASRAAAASAYV